MDAPKWPGREEIKNATIALLRRLLVLTQTLGALPKRRDLVMRLTYYQDVTPKDYSPRFFQSSFSPSHEGANAATGDAIRVGELVTPFHSLAFTYVSNYTTLCLSATAPRLLRRFLERKKKKTRRSTQFFALSNKFGATFPPTTLCTFRRWPCIATQAPRSVLSSYVFRLPTILD